MITIMLRSIWLLVLCVLLASAATALGKNMPREGQLVYTSGMGRTRLLAFELVAGITVPIADWVYPVTRLFPSPDGQRIAFYGDDGYLHIVNSDGSNHITLDSVMYNANVQWLLNNRDIVITTFTEPPLLININEQTQTRLSTGVEFQCGRIFVSPNGQRIAIEQAQVEADSFLCGGMSLMDADGGNPIEVLSREEAPSANSLTALWSPDGSHAVLYDFDGVYLMKDGNPVTVEQVSLLGLVEEYAMPVWSPDSTRLAFILGRAGDITIIPLVPEVGEMRMLTNTRYSEASLAWSPDGTQLAFISDDSSDREVFSLNLTTGEQRQLTENREVESFVVWLP